MSERADMLNVVEEEPLNAETPLHLLAEPVTPLDAFFVRSNFTVPRIDAAEWRLTIGGLVGTPLQLALSDVQALGRIETTSVMECAGNGRRLMSPVPDGTPWGLGAVSTGRFTGVSLSAVLDACDIDPRVVEIVFRGADSGPVDGDESSHVQAAGGRIVHFERSLPLARALDPATMLVWAMNGEPLRPEHGHPVRLFVPGYYGVASVKWLTHVTAVDTPFTGHFQTDRYVYRGHPAQPEDEPVTRMQVRSLITSPAADDVVDGTTTVRGLAWSGDGAIARVEVSADGGVTWLDARLRRGSSGLEPTLWECECPLRGAGEYELVARATDATGAVQPLESVWNELGYANNVGHRVRVRVR